MLSAQLILSLCSQQFNRSDLKQGKSGPPSNTTRAITREDNKYNLSNQAEIVLFDGGNNISNFLCAHSTTVVQIPVRKSHNL